MRHFCVTIYLFLLSVIGHGQDNELVISGEYSNRLFKDVIEDIESKYPFRFFYLSEWDSLSTTLNLNEVSIQNFLKELSVSTDLNFFIHSNNNIVVTQKFEISPRLSANFFDVGGSPIDGERTFWSILDDLKEPIETQEKDGVENTLYEIGNISGSNKGEKATIAGIIKEEKTGEPIVGATVSIKNPVMGVVSDQIGFYSFTLPKGKHEIHINSVGKKRVRLQVMLYSDGNLNVDMKEEIVALKEVVVSAERSTLDDIQTGVARLNIKNIKQIPTLFGEADVMKIALTLPGVQSVGEGASGFNVRGGGTDQNLILLNDVPIYNTNHLFGFFSVFNSDVISDANLYKSGIQAQYGGRISSVFDVALREGNRKEFSIKGGISPATGRVALEGPINKGTGSYILGVRSTYSDWIFSLLEDPALRNSTGSFSDLTARINYQIDQKNSLALSGYHSRDDFKLNSDTLYRYFNSNMAIQWRHSFNNKFYALTAVNYANYSYDLSSDQKLVNAFKVGYEINQTTVKTDFTFLPDSRNSIRFGASSIFYHLNPGNREPLGPESIVESVILDSENGIESALYLGNEFEFNTRLSFYGGLRLSLFNSIGPGKSFIYKTEGPKEVDFIVDTLFYENGDMIKTYVGPEYRFSSRYKLNQDLSVKFSYDRTRQYIHLLSNTISVSPTDTWRLSNRHIKPQIGDQVSIGIYRRFFGTGVEASAEGYFKRIRNTLEYKDGADLLLNEVLEADVVNALTNSYGLEFLIKKTTGKVNGWISYTYSRSLVKANGDFPSERINSGRFFPSNFDKPHILVVISNYKFNRRVNVSLNLTYNSGRPTTFPQTEYQFNGQPVVAYTDRNQFRIPDYFRVDFALNFEGNHKVKKRVHGSWSFSIYNLTGRANAYSVFFRSEEGEIKGYKLSVFTNPIPTLTYNFIFR